eukprot:TRINITY_DN622_c0_g1_i2.p2 TRINITY_DN622_c0_g1~~TRINITY_DN622_c0_g1_i2.p2  ORF type:complete len:128 (+),score=41.86 TRINITY_DN622_c0_g1_i2:178-561(+)
MAFSLTVRESFMIAHSFKGEAFGPAQAMHGATYVTDVTFTTAELQKDVNFVIDIGVASTILKEVLGQYNYKNLDELEKFKGQNTTTEFMAQQVAQDIASRLKGKFTGKIKVTLHESHNAWGSFKLNV